MSTSKLQKTDSLQQWSIKINTLIDDVNSLSSVGGLFTSDSPTEGDTILYSGSEFINKGLTGQIVYDSSWGATGPDIKLKLTGEAITSQTDIGGSSGLQTTDYLLIYDNSVGDLRKVSATELLGITGPGGSNTQVQFNSSGSLAGDSGLTYNSSTDTLTIGGGLTVDTNTLFVDATNNRVGIGTSSPSYSLDIAGSLNLSSGQSFRISGSSVLTANSLGSSVTASSLTSLGTITSLSAGSGTFSGALSSATLAVAASCTVGTTLGVTGAATFGSTISVTGTSSLAAATISSTLAVTGAVTMASTLDISGMAYFAGATEKGTITATAPTSTTNFDAKTQSVQYYTLQATTNWTLNVRGNSTTSLSSMLDIGEAVTIVMIAECGITPYYMTSLQVDGTSVSIQWQGGVAPSAGFASSKNIYSITIMKDFFGTGYYVLASLVKFA